jgi:hypothetical protein
MEPAALIFSSPLAGLSLRQDLDHLVRMHAERKQSFGTFFLRNCAELELLRRVERMSKDELEAMFELQGEGGLRTGSNGARAMRATPTCSEQWVRRNS